MQASIRLGRIFGVPIGLHYSWFIIAALITFSLGTHFRMTNPGWSTTTLWITAVVTALLFFAALVAHELSHALVARSKGLPVRSITLFALGGVAQIEREAATARHELWIGIAGPLMSLAIGFACLGVAGAMGWSLQAPAPSPTAAVVGWLGYINVALAIFNLIPGFPLDGGRVLRAALWGLWGNAERATRAAARVGQTVAFMFMALGLLVFFAGGGFGGLWLAFIGWFLLEAAQTSYTQVAVTQQLRDVRVGDVMAQDCALVDGRTNLRQFVDEELIRTGRRCFMVRNNGQVIGLITPHDVKQVDQRLWPEVLVSDAMRPLQELRTVSPQTTASEALSLMGRDDVNQLPVMSNGRLEGVISRGHILQLLQSRAELNV